MLDYLCDDCREAFEEVKSNLDALGIEYILSLIHILTTLICMIPLFFMVSTSIREFVLPLMVGVLVGTYSSIFLCSPLFYEFSRSEERSKYMTAQAKSKKKK